MAANAWPCGCTQEREDALNVRVDHYCVEHEPLGRIATLLVNLCEARELWEALEASPASSVRELANTIYFRAQDAAGRALALLTIAQGPARP